MSNNFYY